MKRRFLSILFTLCMLFSLTPTTVLADEVDVVTVSTTEELKNALNNSTIKNINLNGTITLDGEYDTTGKTISGGTIQTDNNNDSRLKFTGDGKIYSSVFVQLHGILNGGNFFGSVTNNGRIQNGTFNGEVINNDSCLILGGIFNNTVRGYSSIQDGEFNGEVLYVLYIGGGKFHNKVSGERSSTTITDGTFYSEVSNICFIKGGVFYGELADCASPEGTAYVTVKYFVDGQEESEESILRGPNATAPTNLENEGYHLDGWYTDDACTKKYDFDNDAITDNISLYAKWIINSYTVTFKDGENTIKTITQDYGTPITPPENPTKTGYTFDGWDTEVPATMPAKDLIIKPKWEANQYVIRFVTNGGTKIEPIMQEYGQKISNSFETTKTGYTFDGWYTDKDCTKQYDFNNTITGNLTLYAKWKDDIAPTGEIQISDKTWDSFFNKITFGLFFKDTQKVTISGSDTSGEPVTIEYLLADKEISLDELANKTFKKYDGSFNIDPNQKYIVYAKVTDHAGNVTYINSDGVVLDSVVPVISGIEDGKTYCESKKVTVKDDYLDSVTVNGKVVNLNSDHSFVLSPSDSKQMIVVKDKAGNTTEMSVTINDGHIYEWQSGHGEYWKKCKICDKETSKVAIPSLEISGLDKVCRSQDYTFTFTLPKTLAYVNSAYEFEKVGSDLSATKENGSYSVVLKSSSYPSEEKSFKVVVYAQTADGFMVKTEKTVSILDEHAGGVATCKDKAKCSICGKEYGKLNATNHTNLTYVPAVASTTEKTGNLAYWHCTGCGKYFSDKKGTKEIALKDTITSKLPPKMISKSGPIIEINKKYGVKHKKTYDVINDTNDEIEELKKHLQFTSNAAFRDFVRVDLDGKTVDEKNYTKKEGSTIITLNDDFVYTLSEGEHTIDIVSTTGTASATFIIKFVSDTTGNKNPKTGTNLNVSLWMSLLIVSGAAFVGVLYKKKRYMK